MLDYLILFHSGAFSQPLLQLLYFPFSSVSKWRSIGGDVPRMIQKRFRRAWLRLRLLY